MGKFLLGLVLGLALGAGGVYLWLAPPANPSPAASAPATAPAAPEAGGKKKKKRPGEARSAAADPPEAGAAPAAALSPEELSLEARGDALTPRPAALDMEDAAPRDLSQAEVEAAFRGASGEIKGCISEASAGAQVSGRVTVGLVVGPKGGVEKTRVEGPAYLMARGLYGCIKAAVSGLAFPAPGRDTVVSMPYTVGSRQ